MANPVDYVFLHGGMQGAWVWQETIGALRAQAGESVGRTLALDARLRRQTGPGHLTAGYRRGGC